MDPDEDTLDLTEALAELREYHEPCDCPWHRRRDHAARLCAGSAALTQRAGAWLVAEDWRTALGHAAAAGGAAWAAVNLAEQQKMLVPAATIVWCIAAFRTGVPEAADDAEASCDEHREALLDWLDHITRGDNGIHLAELYERLRERPALAHLDDAALRTVLDHYGIPVRRSFRARGIPGRSGVHRDDLAALRSPTEPQPPLSEGEEPDQDGNLRPLSAPEDHPGEQPCDE